MKTTDAPRLNPFPGLRPFRSDEHHLFFGREEQTAALLQRLRAHRFLAVVGTSGSGKSSLVRAGLIAGLHGGTMAQAGSTWEVLILRPGGSPVENLARALVEADLYEEADAGTVPRLLATLRRSRFGLVEALKQSGALAANANVLIVVDQFEELFRFRQQGVDSEEAAASFVNLLLTASEQEACPIYVTITMRSDYLGDCSEIPGLAEAVNAGEYLIPRLHRDQKREAIEKPIGVGGTKIEPLLVHRLLNEVGDDPDQLPVLQHALMRLWGVWAEGGDHKRPIEVADFAATGGLEAALSNHADEIYDGLPDDYHRVACEKIFQTLTEKGGDNRGIRRPTRLVRLIAIADAGRDTVTTVVDAFRGAGVTFLMPGKEVELDDQTVLDLSHESLMRGWQRLRGWVESEAQSARIYRRLLDTARLWGDGKAGLFRDPDLQIALSWRGQKQPNAEWAEEYGGDFVAAMGFLEASKTAAEAERRATESARQRELDQARQLAEAQKLRLAQQLRSARKLRQMLVGLGVVAVIAVGTSLVAAQFWQAANVAKRKADEQRDEANRTRNAAARQAAGLLFDRGIEDARAGEPSRALHLFVRALRTLPTDDLQAAAFERVIRMNLQAWAETLPALEHIWPSGPRFQDVAFTPDGEAIAMAIGKDAVQCFRTDTGRPVGPPIKVPVGNSAAMEFAADGRSLWVASPGFEKVVEKWALHRLDPKSGSPVQSPITSPGPIDLLACTPDGRYVVAAVLGLHPDDVGPRADAAGARVWRTASIMVWEAASGRLIRTIPVDAHQVISGGYHHLSTLGLSPDGKTVTTWFPRGSEYEGLTFSVEGNDPATRLGRHPLGTVSFATLHFQHNLRTGLAVKDDQVHRWSMKNPGVLERGVPAPFRQMHENPSVDGRSVSTPAEGRVFDTGTWPPRPTNVRFAHPGWQQIVNNKEPSPDGRFAVTWSWMGQGDGRLWRLPRPHSRPALAYSEVARQPIQMATYDHTGLDLHGTTAILWSPQRADQPTTATPNVRLVDLATGAMRATSVHHSAQIREVVFTADGRYFATASFDATARVWETATGRPAGPPLRHDNYVATIAFSPDGITLAAGDYGPAGLIKLWDWRAGKEVRPPLSHDDIVLGVSFSPDGRYLAAIKAKDWSDNPELLVWDVSSGTAVIKERHTGPSYLLRETARFRPDGRAVITRDVNGVLRLWEVPSGKLHGERPLDGDGITRFSPDGRVVAAAANLGVRLLDGDTLAPLPAGYLPHPDPIKDVAFSPDGALLLTAHESGSAQLWDVATRKPVGPPAVLIGPIRAVTFTPEGKTCVSVAVDGTIRRWPVPAPFALADLDLLADRVALMTSQRMDDNQGLDSVPSGEWHALRAKLVGETSTALVPQQPDADWHDKIAADAAQDRDAFGAQWHFDRLAALRPKDWTIPARRGRVLAAAGLRDEADVAYAAARRLAPSPQVLSDWLRSIATDDEAAGRQEQALWSLNRAVELTPDDWTLYAARAALAYTTGDRDRATKDVDEMIRRGANDAGTVGQLAGLAGGAGDWKRAAALFAGVAKESSLAPEDSYRWALAALKAGDVTAFQAACAGVTERLPPIGPQLSRVRARRAAMVFALRANPAGNLTQPLAWIDHALALAAAVEKPTLPLKNLFLQVHHAYLNTRGALLYRAGRFGEAVQVLREGMALRADGGDVQDWAYLALAEHRLGHTNAAQAAAAKARVTQKKAQRDVWATAEIELLAAELDAALPPTPN